MAHEARSNVCYSGAVYAGLSTRTFGLTIDGSNRLDDGRQKIGFTITKQLDAQSSATLTVGGTRPSEGADLLMTLGGELLFGGTIQRVRSVQEGGRGTLMSWNLVATDWWWLLNRYARVTGRFAGGVNVIVGRILAGYTNGGFLPGYLPSSLGDVDMVFDDVPVGDCLKRIAKASNGGAGAFLRLTPFKLVDIATSFPDGLSLTLVNASNRSAVVNEGSLDQVRTRVYARGQSTQTTAAVPASATTIPVEECGLFADTDTVWVQGVGAVTYTGRSASSGPGSLTGASGLTHDIAQGGVVQVYAVVNDATAQTALATRLGGGRSGIAVHSVQNEAWTLTEATAQAGAHLALLKDPQSALSIEGVAMNAAEMQQQEPGAVLSATVTVPQTFSGSYRLQQVRISAFGPLNGTEPKFNVSLSARSTVGVNLFDLLGVLS